MADGFQRYTRILLMTIVLDFLAEERIFSRVWDFLPKIIDTTPGPVYLPDLVKATGSREEYPLVPSSGFEVLP